MRRTLIYHTLFREKATGLVCSYIGSHATDDDLWPSPGCKDNYVGSSRIVMSKKEHCTIFDIKPEWEWLSTQVLQEVTGESTLAVEGMYIESAMQLFGIHPLAKKLIRKRSNMHPLLAFKDGTCLNCHKNSDKFQDTEYYKKWLKGQGFRSALGNTPEARAKANATRLSHKDQLSAEAFVRMKAFAMTDLGKSLQREMSKKGNTPEARAKANATRLSHKDQWICLDRPDLGELPIRGLGEAIGLGRGPQQCWSRLGKPDKFIFKNYSFKLVSHEISSHDEK